MRVMAMPLAYDPSFIHFSSEVYCSCALTWKLLCIPFDYSSFLDEKASLCLKLHL